MPSTIAIVISIAAVFFLAALFISEAVHGNLNIKTLTKSGTIPLARPGRLIKKKVHRKTYRGDAAKTFRWDVYRRLN